MGSSIKLKTAPILQHQSPSNAPTLLSLHQCPSLTQRDLRQFSDGLISRQPTSNPLQKLYRQTWKRVCGDPGSHRRCAPLPTERLGSRSGDLKEYVGVHLVMRPYPIRPTDRLPTAAALVRTGNNGEYRLVIMADPSIQVQGLHCVLERQEEWPEELLFLTRTIGS